MNHDLDLVLWDMVPFDTYILNALMFVIEKATNKSVPIIAFAAGEGPNGYAISSNEEKFRSNYTYNSGTRPTTVELDSHMAHIEVKRSQLARAFMICLLLVNSGLAVGSTYVMLLVFFRRDTVPDSTVLLLPVTIVLTVPALRSLYPGSPPFGIFIGRSLDP